MCLTRIAPCNPPSPPSNGQLLPYTSTLEGATVVYVCWTNHKRGQCEEVNVTAVCNRQGHWEPSSEDICAEPRGTCDYNVILHHNSHNIGVGS